MSCLSCASYNQAELSAEILIHFAGLNNLDKPGVWLFQTLLVCLDCGAAQFSVPEKELALLAAGTSISERRAGKADVDDVALPRGIAL
jgi:hypothetical protein